MILQLLNKDHEKVSLIEVKNPVITETLEDKTLSGETYYKYIDCLDNECYLQSETDEYIIKDIKYNDDDISIEAVLNLDELEGKPWESFSSKEQTIDDCIQLAIAGTGWTINKNNKLTKKRTIRKDGTNALAIIKDALKTYLYEAIFDTINKTIEFVEKRGSDRGEYELEKFNNTAIQLENNTDEFYTYIIAMGKVDEKGNAITCTVENHQFSNKMKGLFWKDERYTILEDLKEDAELKLKELSKPRKSYSVTSSFFSENIKIGDTITLISKDKKIRDVQRVVKINKYPDEKGKDSIEVANTSYTFEDIQKKEKETEETVNNVTADNGTISIKAMQDGWVELNKVNVQELDAVKANIGHLEANEIIADILHAHKADIDDLKADKADIKDLTADNIIFNTAEGGSLDLKTLLSQFVSGDLAQFLHLTSSNVVIDEAVIKNLIASKIKVSDLMAGNIDASKFNIVSQDGNLIIKDNTIQISDANRVRIQIGKQADGDYSLSAWDKDGNLMFNSNGITKDAIKSSIIRDDMVADDAAINGGKIDMESLIFNINNNQYYLNTSVLKYDDSDQSFNVLFKKMLSNVADRNMITNGAPYSIDGWEKIKPDLYNDDLFKFYLSDCSESPSGKCMTLDAVFPYNQYFIANKYCIKEKFTAGNKYSIRLWVKANITADVDNVEFYLWLQSENSGLNDEADNFSINIPKDDNWHLVTTTVECITDTSATIEIGFNAFGLNANDNIQWHSLELVKGEFNSDIFSPSPLDVTCVNNVLQTEFNVQQGKISDLIKDTTIEQNGQTVKLKDAFSSIDQSVNEIDVKVSNQESSFNSLKDDVEERVNSCELKVTDDAFTVQVNKNKSRIFKVRYIRDWCGTTSSSSMAKWVEIKAFTNKGVNAAKGITPTSNYDPYVSNIEKITDDSLDSSYPVKITITSTGTPYIQIDLGSVREDIDEIKVWHQWGTSSDPQIYSDTKTEVSSDGVHWYALFDSSVSGTYTETEYGHSVKINNNSYNGSLVTVNENGLDVRNGAITITDKAGDVVLKGTTDGNLLIRGALTNYDSDGNLKLAVRNQKVVLYNDNNEIIGGIGEVKYSNAIRGACLNLDDNGKFAGIAVTGLTEANSYGVVFGYHRSNSCESEEGLHAYRNLNMHGYNIKNFCVQGRSGYNGTFEVVDSISNNTVSYTTLKFVDGVLVGSN